MTRITCSVIYVATVFFVSVGNFPLEEMVAFYKIYFYFFILSFQGKPALGSATSGTRSCPSTFRQCSTTTVSRSKWMGKMSLLAFGTQQGKKTIKISGLWHIRTQLSDFNRLFLQGGHYYYYQIKNKKSVQTKFRC